jgi:AAA domain
MLVCSFLDHVSLSAFCSTTAFFKYVCLKASAFSAINTTVAWLGAAADSASSEQGAASGVGFFNNPKRFNVAITRAMALLVVVGHPDMLRADRQWGHLVCVCTMHSAPSNARCVVIVAASPMVAKEAKQHVCNTRCLIFPCCNVFHHAVAPTAK